jgi:hypothetical protein
MPTIAPERPHTAIRPGYAGFIAFTDAIGEPLAPYQRRVARRFFDSLELVVILPKGNLKTHTAALLGLHHLLVTPDAEVRIVAASRRHAEIVLKRMKGFARHPLVHDRITITYFELRREELRGDLNVVSADGEKLHHAAQAGAETKRGFGPVGLATKSETGKMTKPAAVTA